MNKIDLLKLPNIKTKEDLNHLLLFTNKQLEKFILLKSQQYVSFRIPKKNSDKKRIINAPKKYLKMVQRIILKEILEKIPCSNSSTAFLKKKNGLLENAKIHKENLFLLKIDFCNFFQSIKYNKVKDIFLSVGYNEEVSSYFAELCTFSRELPQGGICSPYISNLACIELDKEIENYCNCRNISYTRYADDLIFSANEDKLLLKLKEDIPGIISKFHTEYFQISINEKKTKFIREPWHKKVTGVTINDNQIKASKKLKREIRQELYFALVKNKKDNNKLIGQIAFVKSIEEDYGLKIKEYANKIYQNSEIKNDELLITISKIAS